MFRLSSRINEPATLSSGKECETEFSVEDTIPTFFGSHDAMQEPLQEKVFPETRNKKDDHSSPRKQQQKQSGLDDLLINLTNTSPKRPIISSRDNKVTPKVVATQVVISSKDNYNSTTLSPRPCQPTGDKKVGEKQTSKSQQRTSCTRRGELEDEAGERPRRRLSLAESLERLPDQSPTPSRAMLRPLSPPPRSPSRHCSASRRRHHQDRQQQDRQQQQQQQRSNKSRGRSRRVHSHQHNSTSLRAQRTLDNTCAQASSSPRRRRRSVSERPTRRTNSSHKQQQQQQQEQSSPFMQQLTLLMEEQLQKRKRQQQQQQQRPRQNSTDDRHHSPLRRSSRTPLRRTTTTATTTTTQPRNRSRSIQRTKLRTLRDTDEFFHC